MQPKEVQPNQLRHHWEIYFFIDPTLILIGLFQYYPASSGIFHSLFRWNGSDISEFVGFENYVDLLKNLEFWNSFKLAFILGFWNVIKMIPALLVAVCIHRCTSEKMQFFYRTLFVVPMVIPGLITVLIWRSFFFEATAGYLNQFLDWTGLMTLLQYGGSYVSAKLADPNLGGLAKAFLESFDWLTAFKAGSSPAWLGDPKIIIIACVVWGFPWVGSFAVLTHLAKLQNISKDVYEAADIDGANWWSRFTKIELPLLMGSIYLLLVFAIIDTIKDAGMILALAGIAGGPGGRATVPALFMLRKAFMDQQMGYACAVGIVLTVVVLLLQKICNMLLQPESESGAKPGKSAWFGILALYAFAEAYLFFKGHLLPKTATLPIFAAFVGGLVLKLALLVSVPVALRKFGAALRNGLILIAAALMASTVLKGADVRWLLFGSALLLMASSSLFKTAIGAAGAVLIGYGVAGNSLNLIVSGVVFIILATPWGRISAQINKAYLARCLKRPDSNVDNWVPYLVLLGLFAAASLLRPLMQFLFSSTAGTKLALRYFGWVLVECAILYVVYAISRITALQRLKKPLIALFAAVVICSYFSPSIGWLAMGSMAICMLTTKPLRSAAILLGLHLVAIGSIGSSFPYVVCGAIIFLAAVPWADWLLKFTQFRAGGFPSMGDLYMARSFALQQQPLYKSASAIGDWGLRFSKHAFIWFVLAFAFLPLYLMLIVSLKDNNQFYLNPTTLTQPTHWENWSTAWAMVSPTVANSIFLSTTATFLIVIFGLAGAYFFARLKVPLSSFLWNALLLLMMMPMIANLVPLFILLRDLSLLNTLTALILVGASGGQAFAIFVFRNFIADIPQDLFEAAEIDGANHFQQLKMVVIPLSGPIMGTVAVMQFLGQWNEFVMPLIVMREQARLPVTVQLIRMAGEYIKLWGPLMAGYAIASIPVIILFTFSMKLFVKGLTEGAVKG